MLNSLDNSVDAKRSQQAIELKRVLNEKERLILELDESQAKHRKAQKELKDKEDGIRNLKGELNRLTLINDELQEKNSYYQRKCKEVKLEQEKTVKEAEAINTQRLNDIEKMLTNIQGDITNKKQSGVIYEYQRSSQDIEALELELEDYRKDYKRLSNLFKKLIIGLRRHGLNNANTVEFFKLGEINFGNKEDVYRNLLKVIAAFHYTNKNRKLLVSFMNRWKTILTTRSPTKKRKVNSRKTTAQKIKQEDAVVLESSGPNKQKLRIEDLDQNDLNELKNQLKEQLMNELEFERAENDVMRTKENEEFKGNATEIYLRIISGLTKYFFTIFSIIAEEAKQKNEYYIYKH